MPNPHDPTIQVPEPQGDGRKYRDDGTEDLTAYGRETLGNYLEDITHNIGDSSRTTVAYNYYPIDNSAGVTETSSGQGIDRADIVTAGLETDQPAFTRNFPDGEDVGDGTAPAVGYFETLSRDETLNNAEPTGQLFSKNEGIAGNTLLPMIKSQREPGEPGVGDTSGQKTFDVPSGAPDVQKKISAILATNRFSPQANTSPHIEDGEFSSSGLDLSQDELGVYNPESDLYDYDKLRNVALLSLLRQTGHRLNASFPSVGLDGIVLHATNVQAGKSKVNTQKLRAKGTHNAPGGVSIPDAALTRDDISGDPLLDQMSYGVLNSPWEPFESFGAGRMMLVTVKAFSSLLASGAVFASVFALLELISGVEVPNDPSGMRYGKHTNVGLVGAVTKQLGVPELQFATWRCMMHGIFRFFGIPDAYLPDWDTDASVPVDTIFGLIAVWVSNIADEITADPSSAFEILFQVIFSAGYYASITRTMNQDLSSLIGALADITSSASETDNAVSAAIRLFFGFNRYNSFRFLMALAQMGNASLLARTRKFPVGQRQAQLRSQMPDNGRSRVSKSRIRRNNLAQAWRHRSSPALFLLPQKQVTAWAIFHGSEEAAELKAAMSMVGDEANQPDGASPYQGQRRRSTLNLDSEANHPYYWATDGNQARLSKEIVKEVENELEMEYMPFYFHDLRTNEVISFHAFLEDVKDSYSVAYQSTKGYGRIDSVHIYKDTDRSISVSWVMVATSREDFDSMWFSINKMVTFLYPQWSKGKRVRAGDHKFIMPFSQIPTATPVVRLRVGDVIRSNYSRYNLAKLFGLAEAVKASTGGTGTDAAEDADFDLSYASTQAAADAAATSTATEEAESTWNTYKTRVSSEPTSEADTAAGWKDGDYCYLKANSATGYTTYDRGPTPESDVPSNATHTETTPFRSRTYTEGETVSQGTVVKRIWLGVGGSGEADHYGAHGGAGGTKAAEYLFRFEDRDSTADPYRPVSGKNHYHEYTVSGNDMVPIRAAATAVEADEQTVTFDDQVTNIATFFDPSNNAIVSSFEEGMGRGMAGVITSFDMDWKDSLWETGHIGSRAPTMVKCSISFSPIHDIVPGLDHTGFPRTMNYPVGRIANRLNTDQYDVGRSGPPMGGDDGGSGDDVRAEFYREESATFGDADFPGDMDAESDD